MLHSSIIRTVELCSRHMWLIIAVALVLGSGSVWYATRHFAVDTDVTKLLSPDLPWRKREMDYRTAFPQQAEAIIAVVSAPTSELAAAAAKALTDQVARQHGLFRSVREVGGGEFFARNGFLYRSTNDLARTMLRLGQAGSFIQALAADPSLRGILHAMSLGLEGVKAGRFALDDMAHPLDMASDTLENVLSGRSAAFSWHVLANGTPAKPPDLRRLIAIWPALDYSALQPGRTPTAAIRKAVEDTKLDSRFLSTVRLTGPVPIADQQFATLREGVALNAMLTSAIVLVILWLALRSWRIVAAVVATVAVGLATTAALGLLLVGALNPISVAFVVLFVGLGADFAIQFSVRYRAERHADDHLPRSLVRTAESVGAPLTLAAGAAAAGFLSFLPTSYNGLAELGLIAGCGMIVAYVASITLLPALLSAFGPPPEPKPLGYHALQPVDRFLQRHRIAVVVATSIIAMAGLPLLVHLQFDFSPTSLQDPHSEAIATLRTLSRNDPMINMDAAEVLTAPADAETVSKRLAALPEVSRTRTLDGFIPDDQDRKLTLIRNASTSIGPTLQASGRPAPSDAEEVAALETAVGSLRQAADEAGGSGPDAASRLADNLEKLAKSDPSLRSKAETAFVLPLKLDLAELRQSLQPQQVTRSTLPTDLVRDWTAPDGRARVEAAPKGDPNDGETLHRFARAVLAVQPNATGQAVETYEWGRTIIFAFMQAGTWALCSITILLWIVLRRVRDVVLTLIPLLVAATVTLEVCALTGFSLNYANIIALPVLLGVGVAFKIYYVIAWRRGETDFLQSTLTRAVFFSALMTATAFGSLWLSKHPGMSSMGKLLALSLVCTLASAALFQPALMGRPRQTKSTPEPLT